MKSTNIHNISEPHGDGLEPGGNVTVSGEHSGTGTLKFLSKKPHGTYPLSWLYPGLNIRRVHSRCFSYFLFSGLASSFIAKILIFFFIFSIFYSSEYINN